MAGLQQAAMPAQPAPQQTQPAPTPSRLDAVTQALSLNPQERDLYQRHLTNLYGTGGIDNADGSRSTMVQTSVGIGDKTYNLPTVWHGKVLPVRDAIAEAEKVGFDKFPSYGSEQEAETRYQAMHAPMEEDTAAYLATRK